MRTGGSGCRAAAARDSGVELVTGSRAATGLLVTCAIACLILLPGKPAKTTAPGAGPGIR